MIRNSVQLILNRIDNMVRHEGLTVILANKSVRRKPGLPFEEASELAAVVVFNNDHTLRLRKNV